MTSRGPFTWLRLHLPVPTTPEAATAAVQALAGMVNQPRIVLEARAQAGAVSWWLGTDRNVLQRVVAAVEPHLPGLRVEDIAAERSLPTTAGQLRAPGHRRTPLDSGRTETVTRGLLGAMAQGKATEMITLQVVLGPRSRPARASGVSAAERRPLQAKLAEYRFGCLLRLAAKAGTPERAYRLVAGVFAALRGLESPGVRLQLDRTSPRRVGSASSPLLWPLELGVSEVVSLLGWPIADRPDAALPGVLAAHPRLLPATTAVAQSDRVLGVSSVDTRPIALSLHDSLRHLHILGPTGVGKSTLLARLALQDIEAGRGVVVIDPKGDLIDDLLARMSDDRRDDVVVLDPQDVKPVGIDCFAGPPDLAADTLLSVFHSLYADSWGPRTHDILHACLLTLARRGDASLAMIPLLLTNSGFRRSVTGREVRADPLGLGSFWSWFEALSDGERTQAIAPLMNKLRPLLLRPGLRGIFGQRRPRFALSDVFTNRRILLVSLSQGSLGPEASRLLGSITVALLWQAAQQRAAVAPAGRHPVMILIDEVQEYLRLPGDLGDALPQARGLGVGFTLAHQHLAQLPTALREAVLANARSRVAFQLSASDAAVMAKATGGQLEAQDFQQLPAFQAYAQLLVGGSPTPWCSLTTEPLAGATDRRVGALRQRSSDSYGQALDGIERDLLELATGGRDGLSDAAESLGRRRPGERP